MQSQRKAYIGLAAICLIWGTTFFAMKVGVRVYPPLLLVAIRQSLAGIILWIIGKLGKFPHPKKKDFISILIMGCFMVIIPTVLIPLQLKYIPSGLLALISSIVPLFVVLINIIFRKSADVTLLTVIGVLFGFVGMIFLFNDNMLEFANPDYLMGFIFAIIGSLSASIGLVYSATNSNKIHPVYTAAYQYLVSSIPIFLLSFLFEDMQHIDFFSQSTLALIYVTIMGSVIALPAYLYALSKLPTTVVSVYAFVNPIIAVVIGAILLHEKVDQNIFIAAACIIGGLYIINKGKSPLAPKGVK